MRRYGTGSFSWRERKRKDGRIVREAVGYVVASDRTKIYGTGRTKEAAEKRAAAKLEVHERSIRTAPTGEAFVGATLADFCQLLLDGKKRLTELSAQKYKGYVGYLRSPEFSIPNGRGGTAVIGDYPLRTVGLYELELFMERICERYAPKTAKEFRTWLITQLRKAVNFGARPDNPARELEPIFVPQADEIDIPIETLDALMDSASGPRMRAALVLMMHGLRFGEVFGLTWDDFEENVATIHRQLQPKRIEEGARRQLALVRRKKSGAAYRARFSEEEMKVLVDSVETAVPIRIWAERRVGQHWEGGFEDGARLIVPGSNGGPWAETTFRREFKKLLARVPEAKHLIPHDFRSWMATTLHNMGVPLKHVQMSLGHSRPETTLRYQRPKSEGGTAAHDAITNYRRGTTT